MIKQIIIVIERHRKGYGAEMRWRKGDAPNPLQKGRKMMRLRMLEATVTAAVVFMGTGCDGGGISRQEFYDRTEELQADMFAGGGGEAVREHRELAARPPDRPLRDSATALVGEIEGLFDELMGLRTELLERAEREPEPEERPGSIARLFGRDPVRRAEGALEQAESRKAGAWGEIRTELEGETIEAVDNGMRRGAREKSQLERWVETDRQTLARVRQESEAREEAEEERPRPEPEKEPAAPAQREAARESSPPEGGAVPRGEAAQEREVAPTRPVVEPEPTPREDPPVPPDPEAVRDSAVAEVAGLGPLHDELIEVLEAIHEALTDREEKRQAGQAVTMARFAKGREVEGLEADVAAEPEWRVTGARRTAGRARARLEREIEEARATLARIRGDGQKEWKGACAPLLHPTRPH